MSDTKPLTWKQFGAFLLAAASFILIWPFAIAGFAWQCITYGFEFGRGAAIRTGMWVSKQ